ncbi:MAG: hypothetical protein ACYC3G_00505 [Minisyncoccota bacterium]
MEPQQNSKKTLWILIALGVVIIISLATYYVMMANKGVEVLEQDKTPEAVSNEVQEGLNSTDLGNLESDINSLDTDINKL